MAMNIPVVNGWRNPEIETRLRMTNGFFYFEDGPFQCALMARALVSMRVIRRTSREGFATTVEEAAAADARMRLVINGSFYPIDPRAAAMPSSAPIFGNVFDRMAGIAIYGTKMEQAACLYLDNGKNPRWNFAIGEPPSDCTAGLGGLIPLIIGNVPVNDTNRRYANAKQYGNGTRFGRLAVACDESTCWSCCNPTARKTASPTISFATSWPGRE
jgi:hypothetical protein